MSIGTKTLQETAELKPAPVGRPKLLKRGEILDAAVELGLENLTMKQLATHLGVGTATLYQYYENRDALMRAAAVRALTELSLPDDQGQHWSIYARDFAVKIETLLADNPTYIYNYQQTDYGLEVLFRLAEKFLAVMKAKGFAPGDAMAVYHIVGLAAVAGAVEISREKAFAAAGQSVNGAVRAQLAAMDEEDLPLLREAVDAYSQSSGGKIDLLLRAAFRSIALDRGEPPDRIFQDNQ